MKNSRTNKKPRLSALIVAGGSGSRLWPASRQHQPKQLMGFLGKQTLLQNTFARLRKGFSIQDIFVATGAHYADAIRKQLPQIPPAHVFLEPARRDIGPALGLAALQLHHKNPAACFVTAWSDHFIKKEASFIESVNAAHELLGKFPNHIIAIGALPQYPHTGFRYIQIDKPLYYLPAGKSKKGGGQIKAYAVKSFKDKPNAETAKRYFNSGQYFWNTGYFVMRAETILSLYKKYLPKVYALLMKIKPALGTPQEQKVIGELYPLMPKVDFEQAIIVKLKKELLMLPANFDWIDVGSWRVIKDVLSSPNENLIYGETLVHESKGNLIYNYEDKLVSAVGLENLIIVNTADALLIANKNDSEKIKELVEKLKQEKKFEKYL